MVLYCHVPAWRVVRVCDKVILSLLFIGSVLRGKVVKANHLVSGRPGFDWVKRLTHVNID